MSVRQHILQRKVPAIGVQNNVKKRRRKKEDKIHKTDHIILQRSTVDTILIYAKIHKNQDHPF